MNALSGIKKQKKKKFLILSASGQNKGLQTQYVELHGKDWAILNERVIKYPENLDELISSIKTESSKLSLKELSELDLLFSDFLLSVAKDILSSMPLGKKKPDLIILNKLTLWYGNIENKEKKQHWSFTLGNPAFIASRIGIPLISDFIERAITEKRKHLLPVLNGDIQISSKIDGIALLANLGLHTRLTAIDPATSKVLVDCDCGPTTALIDMVAEKIGLNQGFDRDGNEALNGDVDISIIEYLKDQFTQCDNFEVKFNKLLSGAKLRKLSNQDLLATVTAFVALTIFDSYRSNYIDQDKPNTLWVSGGGTNNLALIDYLKNYFEPIDVKNVEELGINGNNRIPLSLALTINSWIDGEKIVLPPNIEGSIKTIGTIYLP